MRAFLRDQRSQRYLSVAELNSAVACVMTSRPASLFVCHHVLRPSGRSRKGASPKVEEGVGGESVVPLATSVLGFEHEGIPAFQCFLTCRRRWRNPLVSGATHELRCEGSGFGRGEEFQWHPNSTLQHMPTGLWLYVDPSNPVEVILHASKKSVWEALPTV